MLGDMFLWLVANLKQGVIYFIKQALPPNKSARSVLGLTIAVLLDSLLLCGVSAGPGFKPSRGRAWRRACLRRHARPPKQGPALTPCNNRLYNGTAMGLTIINWRTLTRSPGEYASSVKWPLWWNQLKFLSHTDESFKDKTRVCGCKLKNMKQVFQSVTPHACHETNSQKSHEIKYK